MVRIIKGIPPPPPPIVEPTKETPQDKVTTVVEPINVANGNMFTSQTDILIPAREIPLELSRTYNSQDDFDGSFGYGWRSNFDITSTEQTDHSVIEIDEKGVYTIYTQNPDGTYKPSAGKYSQLTRNADGTYTILRKYGRRLYFDSQGRLIKIEERNGNCLNILRTSSGIITEVSDSSGRKLLFTQGPQGKITQVKDPLDRIYEYEYDSNGNLIKTIDPLNNETLYKYDNNHNLIRQTDANNHSIYFEYDSDDRAHRSCQDENNNAVALSFDPENKTTTSVDSLGNSTIYEYSEYGLVTKITDAQDNIQTFIWDDNLNKISSTDKNLNTTTYTYDTRGNLTSITASLGDTTRFTYEPKFDFVSSVTDALGNITEYLYNVKGNLFQVKDALGNITNYYYSSLGQLIQLKDANNNIANFNYDTYGNLAQIKDALNNPTNFTYDIIGNTIQITDAKGNPTNFAYDLLNRLSQITYPDNSKVNYTYDAVSNLISFIDPTNLTTTYAYDVVNRLAQVLDVLGNTTQHTYDTEGNRLSVIDANLNKTQYFYDSLNRLIKIIDPLNNPTIFNYDPVGNLISKTDANNNTINYSYDANSRLTQIAYPDGSNVSFTYDALGRRISMTDPTGTTIYSYDALGHLIQVDGPRDNDIISYAYDKVGNRIQMTNQDGGITTYTYDSLNRLISLTDSQGKTTTYSYDSLSNLTQMNYPNNTQMEYTFDKLNRLVELVNKSKQGKEWGNKDKGQDRQRPVLPRLKEEIISSYIYSYDLAGMRTKVILKDGSYIEYDYDASNRLSKEAKYNSSGHLRYSYEYSFDAVGNRLTMKEIPPKHIFWRNCGWYFEGKLGDNIKKELDIKLEGEYREELEDNSEETECYPPSILKPSILTKYTYNEANQLIWEEKGLEWKNRFIPFCKIEYLYDNNGNQVEKKILKSYGRRQAERTTYNYDYENRLSKITYPDFAKGEDQGWGSKSATSEYEYDGLGKRIKTIEDEGITVYLYDGLNAIIERNENGKTIATYVRGLSYGGGIGGIISSTRPMVFRKDILKETYYHYDGLGNVTDLTDTHANPKITYTYDAFGNLLSQKGSRGLNPYTFSTKEQDKSGLLYFGARYYEPRVGRFITVDPLGFIDGPNKYIYCVNSPLNLIDPLGLCVEVGYSKIPILSPLKIYHTFIRVTSEGRVKMRGFETTNLWRPFTVLWGWTVPGQVRTEVGGIDYKILTTDPTKAKIVYELVSSEQFDWQWYNYGTKNCYDWRDAVLISAAIESPSDLPWRK